ncbi:hypothetical protein Amsp01_040520 [Amycolatopsis sp. NBRC 101858]|uniref:GH-E family nuclease n=1 Tax=Amycolatopsis sp. NBRC 101858 TaxID=3032200 RepID=UPI0024A20039|nr:GH-E family nuclease [Amycolatopsis sp. NBRC 101858]GLY38028.1 hypothetical protein Amsp01_040520 [Amycolatopsis sp. NBRC 101858]
MTRLVALFRVLAVVAGMVAILFLSEGEASADCTESLQSDAASPADPCGGQSNVVGAVLVSAIAVAATAAAPFARGVQSLSGDQARADARTQVDNLGRPDGQSGGEGQSAVSRPHPEFGLARHLIDLPAKDEAGIRQAALDIVDVASATAAEVAGASGEPAAEITGLAARMTDLADRIGRAPQTTAGLRDELAASLIRLAELRSPLGGPTGLGAGPATPTRAPGHNTPGRFFSGSFRGGWSRAIKKSRDHWMRFDEETDTWASSIEERVPPTYRRVPLRGDVQHEIFKNAPRNGKNEFISAVDETKTIPPEVDRSGRIVRYHRDTGIRLKSTDPGYASDWVPHPARSTFVFGHKPSHEWRSYRFKAYMHGYDRERVIAEQNDPAIYQLEHRNAGHAHEKVFEAPYKDPYTP